MSELLATVHCVDEHRRGLLLGHPTLNGIDYVEYYEDRSVTPPASWLVVTFVKDAPADLVGNPGAFRIAGGARIVRIEVTGVEGPTAANGLGPNQLEVTVSGPGDFSTYTLEVTSPSLDPRLAVASFGFRADCPSGLDCRHEPRCPPPPREEPVLDYLAKDYASFRRLLLDLIPQRNPGWLERNPADLGIALVELLAYAGDHLSYLQDAVATEAYLDTARQRVSARRHARLVDYRMHDGRNAWTFVQLDVDAAGVIPQETQFWTHIDHPLPGAASPPGPVIERADLPADPSDPALREAVPFEATARVRVDPRSNLLHLHAWGDERCCLPAGATSIDVFGVEPGTHTAVRPPLQPGEYVLLEEVRHPETGDPGTADPAHRQVVRLTSVALTEDPLHRADLVDTELQPVDAPGQAVLPLLRLTWREEDALRFPLCLSAVDAEGARIAPVSVGRGNVVPCDQGRTISDDLAPPDPGRDRRAVAELHLPRPNLTFHAEPADPAYDQRGRLRQGRHELDVPAHRARPAVVVFLENADGETDLWLPVPDLLDSHPFDEHFVAEVGNDGTAVLRFGDGEYGRRPDGVVAARARYRVGNGPAGNVGRGSLAHVVRPALADMTDPADPSAPPAAWPDVAAIRHPVPAAGGTDPQAVEEVRQLAPAAFRAEQFRAVTESDYERAALKLPSVAAAKCSFRWTGSWHTVFVGIHPRDRRTLVTEPGGRTRLVEPERRRVLDHLRRYKVAGYDLEVRTASYVPLEVEVRVCVAPGHFRGDVLEEVGRALGTGELEGGALGFFHPNRFAFGQPVYLSRLYAAIERVEGVDSAEVLTFKRYWEVAGLELQDGVIEMGAWEIARLDNDPNFAENGVLTLTAVGGL